MLKTITEFGVDNADKWWFKVLFVVVSVTLVTSDVLLLPALGIIVSIWYGVVVTLRVVGDAEDREPAKEDLW